MKSLLVICSLIAICTASEGVFYSQKYIKEGFHTPAANLLNGTFFPKLDHFRPQDQRTVTFQYSLNLDYYVNGGPLFVYVNDGGLTASTEWIEAGLVVDVARQVGGALATADHRYIGQNLPTEDSSFENFAFLTVEQAVADVAILVVTLQERLGSSNSRVILWGTGYGAALATFTRKKYPHLISAVFSSSGTFRAEVFDTTYHDNLSNNLRTLGSEQCFRRVQSAFDVLEELVENAEIEYITERLRLCSPLDVNNSQEVGLVYEQFIDLISNYIRRYTLYGLANLCRDVDFYPNDPLNSLIRWAIYAYSYDDVECLNISYPYLIGQLGVTNWTETNYPDTRSKFYLRCTQIAAFRIASDYYYSAFPQLLDTDYHYRFCEDIFGEQYNRDLLEPAVRNLNINFGGQEQVVSHVLFTNAGLDPWIGHGVSEYDQEEGGIIFLYYVTAGYDLSSISYDESTELVLAKQQIFETLVRWSQEGPY